jgi:hypothetical protein
MVADTKGGKGSLSTGKIELAVGAQLRCLAPGEPPAPLIRASFGSAPRGQPGSLHRETGRSHLDIVFACIVAGGR